MPDRLYLGKVRAEYKQDNSIVAGEIIFLNMHSWDCGWYWGFGYVGNRNLHCHFDGAFLGSETDVNKIFSDTKITSKEWWILRDLFVQAYALKRAAEVYRHGGHQTSVIGVTDIIKDMDLATRMNADLKKVLDKIWEYVTSINLRKEDEDK